MDNGFPKHFANFGGQITDEHPKMTFHEFALELKWDAHVKIGHEPDNFYTDTLRFFGYPEHSNCKIALFWGIPFFFFIVFVGVFFFWVNNDILLYRNQLENEVGL